MEKYCQFCGSQVVEDAVICPSCGKQIKELKKSEPEINDNSVGLGIGALVGGFFIPLFGWILGGIGLNKANKTNNSTGKYLNIAGIIVGVIMFFIYLGALS